MTPQDLALSAPGVFSEPLLPRRPLVAMPLLGAFCQSGLVLNEEDTAIHTAP